MKFGFRFFIPVLGITVLGVTNLAAEQMFSGHARTRLEFMDNETLADTQAHEVWLNRIRLNADFAPTKSLNVRITPQFSHTWGSMDANDNTDPRFTAHEAWMSWMASDMLTLYLGRQDIEFGKGLIIGHNDWGMVGNQEGTFHDMVRARLSFDLGHTDIMYSKQSEGQTIGGGADQDLFGFYAALNPDAGAVKNVDLYGFWQDDRSGIAGDGDGKDRLFTLGVRADGEINVFTYGLELAAQFGKFKDADSQKGLTADLDVGVKIQDHHVGVNVAYANTEWTGINERAAQAKHADLGDSDVLERNNVLALGILTNWKLQEKWRAKVNGFYFLAPKSDTAKAGGKAQVKDSKNLGLEANLVLSYMAEKNLNFDLGYNLFKPMSYLDGRKLYSNLYLSGIVTF